MAHGSDTQDSSLDSLMSGEWCQRAKQYPLNDPRWTGELNHVSELPGEDRKLQEVGIPRLFTFPSCASPNALRIMASNRAAGRISIRTSASFDPVFHQSCGVPGGAISSTPGSAIATRPASRNPT